MAGPVTKPLPTHAKSGSTSSNKGREEKELPKKPVLKRTKSDESEKGRGVPGSIPRPSESLLDPLNWPKWKKDLVFFSLCLLAGVVSILKNVFLTSNAVIATQCNVTYMAAAALTGLPFIISACVGLVYTIGADMFGKRTIYLISSLMMLAGTVWGMNVLQNYSQLMISRAVQALGWAAFDSLLPVSINDIFFVHQRTARVRIYNMITILFSLGSPIVVGSISQSTHGIHKALMIISIIQAVSIAFLIFGTPETSFDRSLDQGSTGKMPGLHTIISASAPPSSKLKLYLHSVHPMPYRKQVKTATPIASIRFIAAPSVLLTFLLTGSFLAGAQGLAFSLSLVFTSLPIFLFPERIGYLFILPAALSLVSYTSCSLITRIWNRSPKAVTTINPMHSLIGTIPGTVIGMAGFLSFGIYTSMKLSNLEYTISLRVVSLLLGILYSGTTVMAFYSSKYLDAIGAHFSLPAQSSTLYFDANLTTLCTTLQTFLSGIFIIASPIWISPNKDMVTGLKMTVIAISVSQIVVAASILALLWVKGAKVRKLDEKVLNWRKEKRQRIENEWELVKWKSSNSYMDV